MSIVTRCYCPPQGCGMLCCCGAVPLLHLRATVPIMPWLMQLLWHCDAGLTSWHHGAGLTSWHHGAGLALWHHGTGLASQHHGVGPGSCCSVMVPLTQPCIQYEIPLALGPYELLIRSRHPGQHSMDPLLPHISSVNPFTAA